MEKMNKPFLEISVVSTTDANLDVVEVLKKIKRSIMEYPGNPPKSAEITTKPSILFTFASLNHFKAMYENDYRIYSYLYEEIIQKQVDLSANIFKTGAKSLAANSTQESTENKENYIVLRYYSNNIAPMRRHYQLIYKVNEIFGFQITNEEVQDGFLRFFKTKKDFEGLSIGRDEVAKWMEVFRIFKIDVEHPSIKKFIEIIQSYLG
ncbi:hypothetical protein [Candidatus Lokiarchaeum ossiferum]|uniref:hypothetical protein n=1 Tax=Candidatus Lokiarchaeum ossiferum TaxID=2951803 RepID=UPI00352DF155